MYHLTKYSVLKKDWSGVVSKNTSTPLDIITVLLILVMCQMFGKIPTIECHAKNQKHLN